MEKCFYKKQGQYSDYDKGGGAGMNLNRGLKIIEYIHAVLHFAILIPFVYAVAGLSDPAGVGGLYLK